MTTRRAAAVTGIALFFGTMASADAPSSSPSPVSRPLGMVVTANDDGSLLRPTQKPKNIGAIAMTATQTAAPSGPAALRAPDKPQFRSVPDKTAEPDLKLAAIAPAPRLSSPGAITGMMGRGLCGTTGLTGRPIPPIVSRVQGCGLPDGVEVTAVSGIPLSQPVEVDCATARSMQSWVDQGIIPAVAGMGGGLARIEIAGSYSCRPRNNQAGAQISEHGRGHAIDVSALVLRSGDVLSVARDWRTRIGPVLQRVHDTACGTFDTVLGPNSDRFHQDHIHVDTAPGRRGGAYCR